MKKRIAWLLCFGLLLSLWGCAQQSATPTKSGEESDPASVQIGLCLPNQTDARWIAAGQTLTQNLKDLGFQVILEDAGDDVLYQAEQVTALLGKPIKALIICPVDSYGLVEALQHAAVPVIAYDRLLMSTDAVGSFVGYDYTAAGVAVANEIITARQLDTAKAENRSYTLELFMDAPENHNALLFYRGVMQQLQGYLDSGVLSVPSGRVLFEDCCLAEATRNSAADRLSQYLSASEAQVRPDILLCGQDAFALGCGDALTAANCPIEQWPVITGLDYSEEGLDKINTDLQFLSSDYDTQAMASTCVEVVEAALTGAPFGEVVCENGAKSVPAILLAPDLTIGTAPEPIPDATESTAP